MLVGAAGSGKSTLAARFPKPFFLSLDKNLRGPAAVMAGEGKTDAMYEDNFDTDPTGKPIPDNLRYNRFAEVLSAVIQMPEAETIVIDNTTILSDYIIADILRQQNAKAMEIRHWGLYGSAWKQIIAKLRQCPKRVIIIAHERLEKDEIDGQLRFQIGLPGQTADSLPTLVTDVWRCEVEEKLVGNERKFIRQVRVIQSQRHMHLKSSSPGLPAVFPASTEMVNKILTQL